MRAPAAFAMLALASVSSPAMAATAPLPPGRYCAHEPVIASTGRRTFPLGEFHMVVDVWRQGGRYEIAFRNSLPDSQQVLAGHGRAVILQGGVLRFRFEDGWGNQGEGRLDRRGHVVLRMTRSSRDAESVNIGRNYGEFRVSRAGCRAADRSAQG